MNMTAKLPGLKVSALNDREIVMTRSFDAPRDLVFDAFTRPELVRRWLTGPVGWTMPVCDLDLKIGGAFRYLWRNTEGTDMGMRGVFREIRRPERIVHTEIFDDFGGEALVTTVFSEADGITAMHQTVLYDSEEARDMMLKSPMEEGVAQSYRNLDNILAQEGHG